MTETIIPNIEDSDEAGLWLADHGRPYWYVEQLEFSRHLVRYYGHQGNALARYNALDHTLTLFHCGSNSPITEPKKRQTTLIQDEWADLIEGLI